MTPSPFAHDRLSDGELVAEVTRLAGCERQATAHLIAALAELDARRLYLGQGCSSMFTYCTQVLHLAEHAAYNRIEAARAARRFPLILALLGDGCVHLSTVRGGRMDPEWELGSLSGDAALIVLRSSRIGFELSSLGSDRRTSGLFNAQTPMGGLREHEQ
jgi:hypothetical protein